MQGGTFHLLPAGTPIPDTSRVLQNRKLGLLIAQFRQIYDLVIIDSPPVLPVPDALILGRWVDGAVLAVRYDISRFPQVERARRQLDGAGICRPGDRDQRHEELRLLLWAVQLQPAAGRPRPIRPPRSRILLEAGPARGRSPEAAGRRRAARRRHDVSDRAGAAHAAGPWLSIARSEPTVILGRLHRQVQPMGTESAPRSLAAAGDAVSRRSPMHCSRRRISTGGRA